METLWKSEGNDALTYLRAKRGLSDEVIKEFNFGYCPDHVNHELSGRIIMPLYDAYNNLIAITSRNPDIAKEFQHWHESFDKGIFLFGLNVAKQSIYKTNKAIVVEGQFDTTCLHSFGFKQTVGVLGSAFNIMHVTLLARMCSEIFLVLDSDSSGSSGIERALQTAKDYSLKTHDIRFIPVSMPTEVDPDQYVIQYGPKSFVDLLKKSKEKYLV